MITDNRQNTLTTKHDYCQQFSTRLRGKRRERGTGKTTFVCPAYLSSLKYVTPNPLGGCAFLLSNMLVTISTATVTT